MEMEEWCSSKPGEIEGKKKGSSFPPPKLSNHHSHFFLRFFFVLFLFFLCLHPPEFWILGGVNTKTEDKQKRKLWELGAPKKSYSLICCSIYFASKKNFKKHP